MNSRHVLTASVIGGVVAAAGAQVTAYDLSYESIGVQAAATAAPVVSTHYFSAHVYAMTGVDFANGTLQVPNTFTPKTLWADGINGFSFVDGPYSSQLAVTILYPTGTYQVDVFGGFVAAQTMQYSVAARFWPSVQPVFAAASFNAMQALDPAMGLTVSFNSFTAPFPANSARTFLTVTDQSDFSTVFFGSVAQPATSIVIPAGTFAAGHPYAFTLTHSSRLSGIDVTQPLQPGTLCSFDLTTVATGVAIVPPPCSADFNQDGGVDGADVEAFFLTWMTGEPAGDVNQDGGTDGGDIETFIVQWQNGGC